MKKIFLTVVLLLTFFTATAFAETITSEEYLYTSPTFNYSIKCPIKPLAVVVNPFPESDKRGELLVFEPGEGINVRHGYIIELDSFNPNAVPDFNKDSQKIVDAYIEGKKNSNEYAVVDLVNITKQNKGALMITAKEIQVDEDGDGNFDGLAVAENQIAITYFRTPISGRCVSIELVADEITEDWLKVYQASVASFRDATEMKENPSSGDKKNKKDKKQKKDKKDKKNDKK